MELLGLDDKIEPQGEITPGVLLNAETARALEEHEKERRAELFARLDALGQSLARTRSEAIAARQTSGIEEEWLEDEEFYQGIDDANRGEAKSSTWRKKPPGQAQAEGEKTTRSTVFPNITGPYVDAAAARIADMLLPTDDANFHIGPSPLPELDSIAKQKFPKAMLQKVAAMYPGQPDLAKKELAKAVEQVTQTLEEAREKADKAQKRIDDWHVECQYHAQVRLVIEDAARIGTGILKGPFPIKQKLVKWQDGQLQRVTKTVPGSKWIDPWNFFPDGACGEYIKNGSYTWERDYLTKKMIRELKDQDGYIPEQIELCLVEGAHRATAEYKPTPDAPQIDPKEKDLYEVWYYYGTVEREDLEAAGCDCTGEEDVYLPACMTMVNNRVIKADLNVLESEEFPYDVMVWRRRSGYWAGIGVARQIRVPQRIVTAGVRNMMDNAGIAGGPMLVFRQGKVFPANGVGEVAPRKIWYIGEDADEIDDATKAIGILKVDMLVGEYLAILNFALQLAEHVTGLPLLLQGQMGKAPDTVGGMTMLNNNASAVLRRLARLFDDRITEPHVRRYYVWLLLHGPDDEKGDYQIDARGSSALVERDIQNTELAQMGNIVLDPRFGLDPRKWVKEYLQSRHLDPKRFEFDDEQWKQILENLSKGPGDPRMAVAQLRSQTEEKLLQLEQAFEQNENERNRQLEIALSTMENVAKGAEISGDERNTLADAKRSLAETAMKLRTQIQLSREGNIEGRRREASKPPTEPRGRAQPGRSYVQ